MNIFFNISVKELTLMTYNVNINMINLYLLLRNKNNMNVTISDRKIFK